MAQKDSIVSSVFVHEPAESLAPEGLVQAFNQAVNLFTISQHQHHAHVEYSVRGAFEIA
jgi:hypothetical protein